MNEEVPLEEIPLLLIVIPGFPEVNIFTRTASRTTALGPINVATSASEVPGWRVAVVDENNYNGPRDKKGLPDHSQLQREDPATVVGFYCGLTSTVDRVYELARLYKSWGAITIAGGWHAHYRSAEALDNHIDCVVHGDGEAAIGQILSAIECGRSFAHIPGVSFWQEGQQKSNPPYALEIPDLNSLPLPNFDLLKRSGKIHTYPVGGTRGCAMGCEFCGVKGKPRTSSPEHLFGIVDHLVRTRGARSFFIVDDRLEQNLRGATEFFELVAQKYGDRLRFTVQIRLETARKADFLRVMKKAGVRVVAVGIESPIDEDLNAMNKGYKSKDMLKWVRVLAKYFWVHGMFIFGYPHKVHSILTAQEMVLLFKDFISKARLSTLQITHPVPIVGAELYARLKGEGRILPRSIVPWSKYDGSYVCFIPHNMTVRELQEIPIELMRWFYRSWFLRMPFHTISLPIHCAIAGWRHWHQGWIQELSRCLGHCRIVGWKRRMVRSQFLSNLERFVQVQNPASSQRG